MTIIEERWVDVVDAPVPACFALPLADDWGTVRLLRVEVVRYRPEDGGYRREVHYFEVFDAALMPVSPEGYAAASAQFLGAPDAAP